MDQSSADEEAADPAAELPLQLLLRVQEQDLIAEQLEYRRRELPERALMASVSEQVAALRERRADVGADEEALVKRQAQLEAQVSSFDSRIAAIEARMREGGDYRDVQAMSNEAASLGRHRRELEDIELEAMEQLESVEQAIAAIDAEIATLGEQELAHRTELSSSEQQLDEELAFVRAKRGELAAGLPEHLATIYERLRTRLGGIGAARLVDGACSGCHLKLPSSERERVLHSDPGEIAYCDQCGRILVP